MIRPIITAIGLTLLAVLTGANAAAPPDEAAFLQAIGADPIHVTYLDAEQHRVAYSAIEKQMATGGSFTLKKLEDGTVVVQIESAQRGPAAARHIKALPAIELQDLDSKPISAVDPAKKYTLLSFYFAKCDPCIREVSTLNQFAALHPDINSLAITFDSPEIAREFSNKYGLEWRVAANAKGYISALAVTSYPTLLVADANGKILARKTGGILGEEPAAQLAVLESFVNHAIRH